LGKIKAATPTYVKLTMGSLMTSQAAEVDCPRRQKFNNIQWYQTDAAVRVPEAGSLKKSEVDLN
jgi:hypothetical protein